MKKVDYAEFLELAKQCVDEQYDQDCTDYRKMLERAEEFQEEYRRPEKIVQANSSSDATNLQKDKIRNAIETAGNLEVGKFTLKIKRPEGAVEKRKQKDGCLNISIYERGIDKIHRKVQIADDNRFKEAPFLDYFKDYLKAGQEVPIEIVVEVVRWLQAIEKLLLFF